MEPRLTSVDTLVNAPTHVKCAANDSLNEATSVLTRSYMSKSSLFHASLKAAASISRNWEISRCIPSA